MQDQQAEQEAITTRVTLDTFNSDLNLAIDEDG